MPGIARLLHEQQIHYFRKRVNWNDNNIANGVLFGTLPKGAIIHSAVVRVLTAFNAATTNALNVGTTAGGAQVFTDPATAGQRAPAVASLDFTAADQDLFVSYAQTGAAATAGLADIIVAYVPNNDQ